MAVIAASRPPPQAAAPSLSGTLPIGLPTLLFGLRMWAAVALALYVAFRLQMDDPSWAGTTAAIVCQPAVGASLRKGWFRLIGTVLGAVVIVLLTAAFPQSRAGFMIALALWGAVCGFASSLLRNFASYAAALAGYTAAIIAADTLGATGGASDAVFLLAISRASEIMLGIFCASVVLALSDFGQARRILGAQLAGFAAEIARGLAATLRPQGVTDAARAERRSLLRRIGGLGVTMDQASGEISNLPFRPRVLQTAIEALYGACSAWRLAATHLEQRPHPARDAAARILAAVPAEVAADADAQHWQDDPLAVRQACEQGARALVRLRAASPSERLLADSMAEALVALARALTGVAVLRVPRLVAARGHWARLRIPDLLPPVLAGLRVFATLAAAELFWVVSAWPAGGTMVLFAAVTIILFAPREDAAFGAMMLFLIGTAITTVFAAIIQFAVLPAQAGFVGLALAIGLVLVPAGALSAQSWQQPAFIAMATNFIPLLGPTNPASYDPSGFYNTALALLTGVAAAALAVRLMPPLPPATRARRLVALTLRELRRTVAEARIARAADWEGRVYARLAAISDRAELIQPARLVAALFVGTELLRLRRTAVRIGMTAALAPALAALREGHSARAIDELMLFDAAIAGLPDDAGARRRRLRARGGIMAIAEALRVHADYFDAEP